ncbi:MAG: hypothetical protein WBA28_08745 [Microbacteriaceae bacterium]
MMTEQVDVAALLAAYNPLDFDMFIRQGKTARFLREMRGGVEECFTFLVEGKELLSEEEIAEMYSDRYVLQDVFVFPEPAPNGPAIVYERQIESSLSAKEFRRRHHLRIKPNYLENDIQNPSYISDFWDDLATVHGRVNLDSLQKLLDGLEEIGTYRLPWFFRMLQYKLFAIDHPKNAVYHDGAIDTEQSLALRCAVLLAGKDHYTKVLSKPGIRPASYPGFEQASLIFRFLAAAQPVLPQLKMPVSVEVGSNILLWDGEYPSPYHRFGNTDDDLNLHFKSLDVSLAAVRSGLYRIGTKTKSDTYKGTHFGARFYLKKARAYQEIIVFLVGDTSLLGNTEQQVRDFGEALAKERGAEFIDFIELDGGFMGNFGSVHMAFSAKEKYLLDEVPDE